jgi:hypothetical protein
LLSLALTKLRINLSVQSKTTVVWLLHYVIGFLFVVAYHIVWIRNIMSLSIESALVLGAISGIIGVLGWIFIFKISNYQLDSSYKGGYYLQLFIAHIIFAGAATAVYSFFLAV